MTLPEKINTCRKRAGLSQEALAERLGVSRQAVSKWEIGDSTPELTKLPPMAEIFGVTVDWLLSEEDFPKETPPSAPEKSDAPSWVDNLPKNFKRLIKRFGWLGGLYISLLGLGPLFVGFAAKYTLRGMFSGFPQGTIPPAMAANSPVSIMASLFILIGTVAIVVGVVLALILRHWGRKNS